MDNLALLPRRPLFQSVSPGVNTLPYLRGSVTVARAHLGLLLLGTDGGRVYAFSLARMERDKTKEEAKTEDEEEARTTNEGDLDVNDGHLWYCQTPRASPIVAVDAAYTSCDRLEITFATK